jgi:hypothetical protein
MDFVRRLLPQQTRVTESAPKAEAAISGKSNKARGAWRQRMDKGPSLTPRYISLETFQYEHCRGEVHILNQRPCTIQSCTIAWIHTGAAPRC